MFSRLLVAGILSLLLVGCERELPPTSPDSIIAGYRIEGTVTDRMGIPIRNVPITLTYDYEYIDSNPPPSKEYQVTDPNKVIRVKVFDGQDREIRVLYEGRSSAGPLLVEWDQRDANGTIAPSGVYTVRYIVDTEVKKSYPVTVSGTVTAVTDSLGRYMIPGSNLPVGFYPVPRYSSNNASFLGNHRITPYVVLGFHVQPRKSVFIALSKDRVTRADLQLQ